MNNYSWLQKRLHHLVLSSQFMREVTFDLESSVISSTRDYDNHVFIAGLARSGTTILLNAIYESNIFASLTYNDMPFVLAPNLWSKLASHNKNTDLVQRAHGDGIKVSTESPEAFEEVFWKTFNATESQSIDKFKTFVRLIIHKYQKNRYLSKNNQNIRRLDRVCKIFPKSQILVPFRDPVQHAYSLLTQHKKFNEDSKQNKFISNYMKWIGHTEFGPNYIPLHRENLSFKDDVDINHWMEQWYLTYKGCLECQDSNQNLMFVCYEQLCTSKEYWLHILKTLDVEKIYDFEFKESKQEISLKIDSELSNEARSLYTQLSNLSRL